MKPIWVVKRATNTQARNFTPGRDTVGKTAVVGIKDRESNQVNAEVVAHTDSNTLQCFATENTSDDATIYTDEARAYSGLPRKHKAVKHSVGEYVNGVVWNQIR